MTRKSAKRGLAKVLKQLEDYAHVNKKALDQFANFQEEQEQLRRREEELSGSHGKLRQLIETTDMRKEEALARTYKQVAKNF